MADGSNDLMRSNVQEFPLLGGVLDDPA